MLGVMVKYLLCLLLFGCAVDTDEPMVTVVEANDDNKIIYAQPERIGNPCSPAIVLEVNGVVHHIPSMCPIPTKPLPDPESEMVMPIERVQDDNKRSVEDYQNR